MDILYERVVLTKGTDGTVSYYIYPDGYSREPLTAKTVRKKINAYADGAGNFVSDEELEASVRASDGTPREAARVYDLVVGGKKLSRNALEKNGTIYLPALDTARALSVRAEWSPNLAGAPHTSGKGKRRCAERHHLYPVKGYGSTLRTQRRAEGRHVYSVKGNSEKKKRNLFRQVPFLRKNQDSGNGRADSGK